MTAACGGGSPSLTIQSPASGGHIAGNVLSLSLSPSGVTLATPNGSASGGAAHFAVYIDISPPAPGAPVVPGQNVVSSASTHITLSGLTVGRHTLDAVLANGAGNRLSAASASLTVTVDGPAVTAGVVGLVQSNMSFALSITTFGVTIADIPSDTTGKTAHYVILIDRAAPKPGTIPAPGRDLIETTGSLVPIPALSTGRHTLWVALVNGATRVLSPLSAAEVTVTVP